MARVTIRAGKVDRGLDFALDAAKAVARQSSGNSLVYQCGVELDLEDALNDELGTFPDAVNLTAASLASALRRPRVSREFLESLAASLDNPASEWRLILKRNQRGAHKDRKASADRFFRELSVAAWVVVAVEEGARVKSAVSLAQEQSGMSRSAIFRLYSALKGRPAGVKRIMDAYGVAFPDRTSPTNCPK